MDYTLWLGLGCLYTKKRINMYALMHKKKKAKYALKIKKHRHILYNKCIYK